MPRLRFADGTLNSCARLFALHEKYEFAIFFSLAEQLITRLLCESLKIPHRARIGRCHAQNITTGHVGECLLCLQDR